MDTAHNSGSGCKGLTIGVPSIQNPEVGSPDPTVIDLGQGCKAAKWVAHGLPLLLVHLWIASSLRSSQ